MDWICCNLIYAISLQNGYEVEENGMNLQQLNWIEFHCKTVLCDHWTNWITNPFVAWKTIWTLICRSLIVFFFVQYANGSGGTGGNARLPTYLGSLSIVVCFSSLLVSLGISALLIPKQVFFPLYLCSESLIFGSPRISVDLFILALYFDLGWQTVLSRWCRGRGWSWYTSGPSLDLSSCLASIWIWCMVTEGNLPFRPFPWLPPAWTFNSTTLQRVSGFPLSVTDRHCICIHFQFFKDYKKRYDTWMLKIRTASTIETLLIKEGTSSGEGLRLTVWRQFGRGLEIDRLETIVSDSMH